MTSRIVFISLIGIVGLLVLLWAGLAHLHMHRAINADADRLKATPTPLLDHFKQRDLDPAPKFTRVVFEGKLTDREAHVPAVKEGQQGYRIVSAFEWAEGYTILVDLGWVPAAAKTAPRPVGPMRVTGYLYWEE